MGFLPYISLCRFSLLFQFAYPERFRVGTGRIQFLNTRLFKFYGDIGFYHNECRNEGAVLKKATVLQGSDNYFATLAIYQEKLDSKSNSYIFLSFLACLVHSPFIILRSIKLFSENYTLLQDACHETAQMLIELYALGAMIYVLNDLEPKYVQQPARLAPHGSMSYLCSALYYHSPEQVICSLLYFVFFHCQLI